MGFYPEPALLLPKSLTFPRHDLRHLPISKRKCYFSDEFQLQLFNSYSVKNCWMESMTNISKMVNEDRCVPWNFPSADEDMPVCKPKERHRFLKVTALPLRHCYIAAASLVHNWCVTGA